jgi:hypothetical protein
MRSRTRDLHPFHAIRPRKASKAPRGVTVSSITKWSAVSPGQMPRTYPMSWVSAAKTTLVNSLLAVLGVNEVTIALCAPTGRAANRLWSVGRFCRRRPCRPAPPRCRQPAVARADQ